MLLVITTSLEILARVVFVPELIFVIAKADFVVTGFDV
jgi:hypothetical protein